MTLDLVSIVEAIYRLEDSDAVWLRGIVERIRPWLDTDGLGVYGFIDSISSDARLTPGTMVDLGCPDEIREMLRSVPFAHLPDRATARDCSAVEREIGLRIAMHLATAHRLRRRLQNLDALSQAEAIISPSGRVEHATGTAHQNEQQSSSGKALSSRERQVIVEAALGRTNKEIAYALGLADSTVRVLLKRAFEKLGASTRADAIARFATLEHGVSDSAGA